MAGVFALEHSSVLRFAPIRPTVRLRRITGHRTPQHPLRRASMSPAASLRYRVGHRRTSIPERK